MNVGKICSREVDIAQVGETVKSAATRMTHRWVGSLVVVDDSNRPIGVLTDRDIVTRLVAEGKDPETTPIDAVMTPEPKTLPEDESIVSALALMKAEGFRRAPVVNRDRKLVGVLTLDDVLCEIAEQAALVGNVVRRQAPDRRRLREGTTD